MQEPCVWEQESKRPIGDLWRTNWPEDNPADTTVGKKTHIRSPSPPLFPPTHILSHYLELKATLGRRGIFSELKEMFSHGAGDHHRNVNYIKYRL